MVTGFKDIVAATDFRYGLLIWKIIKCEGNSTECEAVPLYRVNIERAGSMSILNSKN
jgi:hypothetical protein